LFPGLSKHSARSLPANARAKEDLNQFTSRFWGLAADHLMHANASSTSQTAEILAILLLTNSLLPDDTLTAAKLELISSAKSRQLHSNSQKVVLSEDIIDISGELTTLDKDIIKQQNRLFQVISAPQ
jgi:hypothetical protein